MIDASWDKRSIERSFRKAMSARFRKACGKYGNPYDKGKDSVSKSIADILSGFKAEVGKKIFFDI